MTYINHCLVPTGGAVIYITHSLLFQTRTQCEIVFEIRKFGSFRDLLQILKIWRGLTGQLSLLITHY